MLFSRKQNVSKNGQSGVQTKGKKGEGGLGVHIHAPPSLGSRTMVYKLRGELGKVAKRRLPPIPFINSFTSAK